MIRTGWTIQEGTIEEIEAVRSEYWKTLTPQERLDALFVLLDTWKGPDARRLERTYRIVEVPRH